MKESIMKEIVITMPTGETRNILIQEKETFRVHKVDFLVVNMNSEEIIISSVRFNNIILKNNLQTKLGNICLEPLTSDSKKSKINVKVYELASKATDVTIEQAIVDLTLEKIERAKSAGLGSDTDIDSNLFKKVFGC